MKLFILLCLTFTYTAFSQTENYRWEKADFTFRIEQKKPKKAITFDSENPAVNLTKSFVFGYRLLISEPDGDNCPFHPSCSTFLIDAVEQTNLIQGTLMFFDRFTRDASFIGRNSRYPKHTSGKLYDPAEQYSFKYYNFILSSEIVTDE